MGADWYIAFTKEPDEAVRKKIEVYEQTIAAGIPAHPDLEKWINTLEYITKSDVDRDAPEKALGHIKMGDTPWGGQDLISIEELRKKGITHIYLACSY